MKKLFFGLAALPLLASVAMAGPSAPLTDAQMDKVTAGLEIVQFPPNQPIIISGSPDFLSCIGACVIINCPTCDGRLGFPTVTINAFVPPTRP